MGLLLAALALLVAPAAMAVQYRGATLSPNGGVTLVLHTDQGDVLAPRTAKDQDGFQDPHISPDGRTVGWLELVPMQGIDGPISGDLVLFHGGKVVRKFGPNVAVIYEWAFADGSKAVAYVTSTLHTPTGFDYEMRRVSDGHLLGKFHCLRTLVGAPPNATFSGNWAHRGKVPVWVWPIAQDCPTK